MKLEKFDPVCAAVLKKTEIEKPAYPVIDFHMHMGKMLLGESYETKYDTKEYVRELQDAGVVCAVNMDGYFGKDLEKMQKKQEGFEEMFFNFMQLDFSAYDDPNFCDKTKKVIEDSCMRGCRGIKLWKDLSLWERDKYGRPIRTDDPRFDIIYDTAAKLHIPVLMHVADPAAFFTPKSEKNERWEELDVCPEWDFSDHEKYMSFEELMEMQENTVRSHPETTFVIAHVGSYAENLEWVSGQLEKYPNMYIDVAARLAELGRVPYSAEKFFVKHQDRILFGTDCTPLSMGYHKIYYRFFETKDEYFPYQPEGELPGQGRWAIYGIGLEDEILKKIYYKNACKVLSLDENRFVGGVR